MPDKIQPRLPEWQAFARDSSASVQGIIAVPATVQKRLGCERVAACHHKLEFPPARIITFGKPLRVVQKISFRRCPLWAFRVVGHCVGSSGPMFEPAPLDADGQERDDRHLTVDRSRQVGWHSWEQTSTISNGGPA